VSLHHKIVDSEHIPLNYKEAFYLATLGGSQVLGAENKIGNFLVGKEFDALVINPFSKDSPFDVFDENMAQQFEKFIFLGDDRNIQQIYVKGKLVNPDVLEGKY